MDAEIPTAADAPIQAVRVSDLTRALAQLPMKARIVVLDAARENPFAKQGRPAASGLALVEPDPGLLIAFNAAPGTVAPPETADDAYGPYARGLAEMMREGGVSLRDVFDQVRLRVSDATKGPSSLGRPTESMRISCSSSAAPTRRSPRRTPLFRLFATGRCGTSARRRPIRRLSSVTRSPPTRISSRPIRTTGRPSASARSLQPVAKRSFGGAHWRTGRRTPTGPI